MGDERVDQGAVGVARRRVDDQPGGLVHHDQMLVLIGDRERDGLRLGRLVRRRRDDERHRLARFDPVSGLRYRLVRDRNPAGLDQGPEPRAGERRHVVRQKPVEPRAVVRPGDGEAAVRRCVRFCGGAHIRYGP